MNGSAPAASASVVLPGARESRAFRPSRAGGRHQRDAPRARRGHGDRFGSSGTAISPRASGAPASSGRPDPTNGRISRRCARTSALSFACLHHSETSPAPGSTVSGPDRLAASTAWLPRATPADGEARTNAPPAASAGGSHAPIEDCPGADGQHRTSAGSASAPPLWWTVVVRRASQVGCSRARPDGWRAMNGERMLPRPLQRPSTRPIKYRKPRKPGPSDHAPKRTRISTGY